ncbi:VTT domain-containing protein [Brevibacterium sp. 50QC2O2]|uniref:DedA family protein n=1 Tax=Brevibacterium sp. 50QC2O2 TaxID=2968459 RepID=UPI00211C85B6|nr:VTT domain-containing protein [Brevibacterium sp. 50QC2O2]MCQ9389636.1 VTT domain-containing protein [Brevibacterium sp. 50QC2O2]
MFDVLSALPQAADSLQGASIEASSLLDPGPLLEAAGPWMLGVVALIVFIESGVLFPFLPGDSLLFVAGMLAPSMGIHIWAVIVTAWIAAFLGDQVGYLLGRRFGRRFFKPDARVLSTVRLQAAEDFFARHGGKSLILARFVPLVRTFTPLAVGIAAYPYKRFVGWNVAGAIGWGALLPLAGHFLGSIAIIRDHVDIWAILIVIVSVLPVVIPWLIGRIKRARGERNREVL